MAVIECLSGNYVARVLNMFVVGGSSLPLYDYECISCGHKFELRQGFDAEPVSECPECNGRSRRKFNAVAVHYKGSGFYTTDYKNNSSSTTSGDNSSSSESKKEETKSEAGTQSSTDTKKDTKKESDSKASSKTKKD